MVLPIDSHPDYLLRPDTNNPWRPRVQMYDATFGLLKTPRMCLHINTSYKRCYGGGMGNPVFDDTVEYWMPSVGTYNYSPELPAAGVVIRVTSQGKGTAAPMWISINP